MHVSLTSYAIFQAFKYRCIAWVLNKLNASWVLSKESVLVISVVKSVLQVPQWLTVPLGSEWDRYGAGETSWREQGREQS